MNAASEKVQADARSYTEEMRQELFALADAATRLDVRLAHLQTMNMPSDIEEKVKASVALRIASDASARAWRAYHEHMQNMATEDLADIAMSPHVELVRAPHA